MADRKKSDLAKFLIKDSGFSRSDIVKILGISSRQYFENKIFRNSFSFEDLIGLAAVGGFRFALIRDSCDKEIIQVFNPVDWLTDEQINNLSNLSLRELKRGEYEDLKEKLNEMKDRYGFED